MSVGDSNQLTLDEDEKRLYNNNKKKFYLLATAMLAIKRDYYTGIEIPPAV